MLPKAILVQPKKNYIYPKIITFNLIRTMSQAQVNTSYDPTLTERDSLHKEVVMLISTSNEFYGLSQQESDKATRKKLYYRAIHDLHLADGVNRKLDSIQFQLEASVSPEISNDPLVKRTVYSEQALPYPLLWRRAKRVGQVATYSFILALVLTGLLYKTQQFYQLPLFLNYLVGLFFVIPFGWYYLNKTLIQFFLQSSLKTTGPDSIK